MKFCYASNAAIKNVKITRKNQLFSPICFGQNRYFSKKYNFFEKMKYIFGF